MSNYHPNRRDQQIGREAIQRIVHKDSPVELSLGICAAVFQDDTIRVNFPGSASFKKALVPRGITVNVDDNLVLMTVIGQALPIVLIAYKSSSQGTSQHPINDMVAPPPGIQGFMGMGLVGVRWQTVSALMLAFDVEWRVPGEMDIPRRERVAGNSLIMNKDYSGDYEFRIRSIIPGGRFSSWSEWREAYGNPVDMDGISNLAEWHMYVGNDEGLATEVDASEFIQISSTGGQLELREGSVYDRFIASEAQIATDKLVDAPPGSVFIWDEQGEGSALPPGTNGQVLTARGEGNQPEWVDPETIASTDTTVTTIIEFDYLDSSPVELYIAQNGETVLNVKLIIDTAFDGTVTMNIGEPGATSRLMGVADNLPELAGMYETSPNYTYGGSAYIRLYKTQSGTTVGSGRVIISTTV